MINNDRIKEILKQSEPNEKPKALKDSGNRQIKFNLGNSYKTTNGNINIFSGGAILVLLLAIFILFF